MLKVGIRTTLGKKMYMTLVLNPLYHAQGVIYIEAEKSISGMLKQTTINDQRIASNWCYTLNAFLFTHCKKLLNAEGKE